MLLIENKYDSTKSNSGAFIAILLLLCVVILPVFAADSPHSARKKARMANFDLISDVDCAQELSQPFTTCTAKVAYGPKLDTAVVVMFSSGFARTLYFNDGKFISANATMSGVGTDTDWVLTNGVHLIRVDDQRYEIPASIIEVK